MSPSSVDYITLLKLIQKYLYRFGGPILLVLGGISCIINILVFNQKKFRKYPCSLYLISFNIASFCLIYTSLLNGTLTAGYDIDMSLWNLTFCRFRIYISYIFDGLAPYYLILASIDRVLYTSSNSLVRQRSTRQMAIKWIIIGSLISIPLHLHLPFYIQIIQLGPNRRTCFYQPGLYTILISYYVFIKAILVPLLLSLFGLWTIKNIRCINTLKPFQTSPASSQAIALIHHIRPTSRSKGRHFIRILLIDITGFVCFGLFHAVFLMYYQITQYHRKTPTQIQFDLFLRYFTLFLRYIPYCLNCYVHILISKPFRIALKKVLRNQ